MKVWIGSEYDYNNGILNGEWVTLTGDYDDDLAAAMEKYSYGGKHDVSVMDTDIDPEEPWTNGMASSMDLDQLEELIAKWDALNDYDKTKVKAAIEAQGAWCVMEIFDSLDDIEFWQNMTLMDVAAELVDEGAFGTIPDSIISSIDYAAVARDLDLEGYTETEYGAVYMA